MRTPDADTQYPGVVALKSLYRRRPTHSPALALPLLPPHARHVRHATQQDLDRLEELLADLRKLPQLRERKRGYFSRGSHAFLHFHEDQGDFYVDVRLDA